MVAWFLLVWIIIFSLVCKDWAFIKGLFGIVLLKLVLMVMGDDECLFVMMTRCLKSVS